MLLAAASVRAGTREEDLAALRSRIESLRSELYRDRIEQANYLAASRYEIVRLLDAIYLVAGGGNIVMIAAAGRGTLTAEDPRFLWMRLAHGPHVLHRLDATTAGQILKAPLVEELAKILTETIAGAEAGPQQAVA